MTTQQQTKPVTAWTIKTSKGELLVHAIYMTKITCIHNFLKAMGRKKWEQAEKLGYSCVKVEIREVEI